MDRIYTDQNFGHLGRDVMDRGKDLTKLARVTLDFITQRHEPTPALTVLREVSRQTGLSEDSVATSISRIADQLNWDYSQGAVRFSLKQADR